MITMEGIADSGYEGWVVWINDGGSTPTPIFEANPLNVNLPQIRAGGKALPQRGIERSVMDWKDLPQEKIMRAELYFYPQVYNQPACRFDREPGNVNVRFIQYKMAGAFVNAGVADDPRIRSEGTGGTTRAGLFGYRFGWWDMAKNISGLFEVTLEHVKDLGVRGHPCHPRPGRFEALNLKRHGWALGPHVVGITEKEIP